VTPSVCAAEGVQFACSEGEVREGAQFDDIWFALPWMNRWLIMVVPHSACCLCFRGI